MEMALQMPNNYVEVTEDEMMYVDGGARTREFRFKNSSVAFWFDIGVIVSGGVSGGVKYVFKKMGKKFAGGAISAKAIDVVAYALNPGKALANFLDRDNDGYVEGYRNHYKGSSGPGWLSIE
ncbi:hypothetical protein [Senegalia sp. (in: firmicutes)]|uniref:hypothetical protein n=1 Tax=Senegalia sp. (in: firmicutes) TaxID=1924098 RepID=UPI003F9BE051